MEGESRSGLSEEYAKASPWPVVIVLGLVLSELGILFNLYPLSVGGLILFVGSVAAIVEEAGYVASPWRLLGGLSVALVAFGLLIVSTQIDGGISAYLSQAAMDDGISAYLSQAAVDNGISQRGFTIAATGAVVAVASLVLPRVQKR